MNQLGKEYRGDVLKPMSNSKVAVSQIGDQITRLLSSRDRLEQIRDRLVGCPPAKGPPENKTVAAVAQDTLVNDFRGLTNGLADAIGEIEILLREIEEFV